jgi:hypothetical protein
MTNSRILCNSCSEPKYNLELRKSKVTGMDIMICRTCIDNGYEPRPLLIIAYHSNDDVMRRKASRYIKNHLYVGQVIALNEVL